MTNAICGCYDEKYSHDDYRYNRIKEQLSISYLNAIASYLGSELQVHGPLIDDDGIDVTIRPPQSRFLDCTNTKPSIDVQMKCTSVRGMIHPATACSSTLTGGSSPRCRSKVSLRHF